MRKSYSAAPPFLSHFPTFLLASFPRGGPATPRDPPHSGLGTGSRQVTVWLEAPSDGGCGLSLRARER